MIRVMVRTALVVSAFAGLCVPSAGAREWVRAELKDMPRGCRVTVYEEPDFKGARWSTTNGWEVIGWEFNDKIRSIKVDSGIWQFFREDHFEKQIETLYPGRYGHLNPNVDNVISSFRCARTT